MRLESKYFFLIFLIAILVTGFFIITKHLGLASKIIDFSFWTLVIATFFYIREVRLNR